jgi:hypothetical protein
VSFNQFGIEGDMAGSSFPLSPELQLQGLAKYEWSINDNIDAFFGVDFSYSDESTTDYAIKEVIDTGENGRGYLPLLAARGATVGEAYPVHPGFQIDERTLIGLQAGIKSSDEQWGLSVWGRNITDEYWVSNTRKSSDSVLAWTGRPATYGITLNYFWN